MRRTCVIAVIGLAAVASGQVEFEWVTVGNAGNAADPATGLGSVLYEYRISAHEVTNAQYAAFLNAVAAADPTFLYNEEMSDDPWGGIIRSGEDGSYGYAVKADMGDKPVNYVSFHDAIQFINWLHNGQGNGSTETGAYAIDYVSDLRMVDARYFLPTQDEWYKAAYHQPASQGGDSDDYWQYATRSNDVPTVATATSTGGISNPGFNVANYNRGAVWNGLVGNLTDVGSAGQSSTSYYGAFDMSGNVWEWNETWIQFKRPIRGGGWSVDEVFLQARVSASIRPPWNEGRWWGFRIASPLPLQCPGDISDDFGTLPPTGGPDGMVSFGDFLALLGLVGPCPGGVPGCTGDIADDFGTLPPLGGADGMVSFGDFLALLGLVGPCP